MIWIKPNGTEIETNDLKETIAYCESLGWKNKDEPKKRGPKPKVKEDVNGD